MIARSRLVLPLLWALLVLECAAIIHVRRPWLLTDSARYIDLAARLQQYGSLSTASGTPEAVRPPLYPIMLWLLQYKLHFATFAIVVLQMLAYLAAVALLYRLMQTHTQRALFLLLLLLSPLAAYHSAAVMTEPWAILFGAIAFFMLHPPLARWKLIVAGVAAGACVLMRPNLAFFPTVFAIGAWWFWRVRGRRAALGAATTVVGVALITMLPYMLRNARAFGVPMPVPPAGSLGNSLYHATWQREIDSDDYVAEVSRLNKSIGAPAGTYPFSAEEYPPNLQQKANAVFMRAALKRIAREPVAYAKHVLGNVFNLGNPRSYPPRTPFVAEVIMRIVAAVVWITGLLAVFLRWDPDVRLSVRVTALTIFALLALQVWLHTEMRYSVPILLFVFYNASAVLGVLFTAKDAKIAKRVVD